MDTSTMIKELRRTAKKHENDKVFTGETDISAMCNEVAARLEELDSRVKELASQSDIKSVTERVADNYKLLIDPRDLQYKVLDYVSSGEVHKTVGTTVFKGNQECLNAVIYGMSLASMLTSKCESFYAKNGE